MSKPNDELPLDRHIQILERAILKLQEELEGADSLKMVLRLTNSLWKLSHGLVRLRQLREMSLRKSSPSVAEELKRLGVTK